MYQDSLSSDHYPIVIRLWCPVNSRSFFSHNIKLNKDELDQLSTLLNNSFPSLQEKINSELLSPVHSYNLFINHLKENVISSSKIYSRSINKNFPNRKSPTPAPWWNSKCSEAICNRKNAIKNYRQHPTQVNFFELKRQEALTKRTLKSAKQQDWRSFCSTITPQTSSSHLWNMIKRFKKRQLGQLPEVGNSNYEIPENIKHTIDFLCPPSALQETYFSLADFNTNYSCPLFNYPFNLAEFKSIIKNLKVRSFPGIDGISYNIIHALPHSFQILLLQILNNIFNEGLFPESWHHSLVFFIPKNSPGKFRPISLTSCF